MTLTEVRTRVAVIRKEDGVLEALFFCVFLQQGALERVDDDEPGLRMLFQKLLDLFHQPVVELLGHDGEVQRGRRVLCEIEEAALDTLEAVLQTEVQHLARACGERPERLAEDFGKALF